MFLPFLSWLVTTNLALWRPEGTSITAIITITIGIYSPVSSNILPIDPYLTLMHAFHVQSQGFISCWCIKISLQVQVKMLISSLLWSAFEIKFNIVVWVWLILILHPEPSWGSWIKKWKRRNKNQCLKRFISCSRSNDSIPYTMSLAVASLPLRTHSSNQQQRWNLESLDSWLLPLAQPVSRNAPCWDLSYSELVIK